MCGIVGGVYFQDSPEIKRLEKAVALLSHRGPDENGLHIVDKVGLGHTRLSIIDIEGGRQPLKSADERLHLIANGEIYNYKEIAARYDAISSAALSHSDSEGILQAYLAKGEAGFAELNGMYAFALYDRETQTTYICRDRLGIKPLFFYENSRGVFFASEIKALLPLLDHSPEIHTESLVQFLQHQFSTGRDTIFEGIKRVLPGEYLVIRDGKISFKHYWSLHTIAPREMSLEQAMEEFEPLFEQVMREHMRSDVPFGLFLSGGIDSSILLAELSQLHDKKLKTFSIGYTGVKMVDEVDAAEALAERFNTEHRSLRVTRDDLFGRIVHSIWAADDLMRDYATLPTHMLAQTAARELKVVFSGEGGDEAFAGYRRYAPKFARWFYHKLLKREFRPHRQWHDPVRARVFSDQLKACKPAQTYPALWRTTPAGWSVMRKRQYVDIKAALADNLFVKTDRMMMAFGLEGRVPLADHRIMEFAFSLPDHLKYHDNRGKRLLREWAAKSLPAEHLKKPKAGFYVPVREWLQGDFVDQIGQKLLANPAINRWFDREGVRDTIYAHKSGKNYSRELWCLIQFTIWHRLFVEKPGIIPAASENPLDWL